jgi:hypothetical protein
MNVNGEVDIEVDDYGHNLFYVVDKLSRQLDLILGQDWLIKNNFIIKR